MTKDVWDRAVQGHPGLRTLPPGDNGVIVRKFFLHLSRDEQKRRFLERIYNPAKNWKFSPTDAQERGFWNDYMAAYEDTIRETATKGAPWYVVPADNKWFTRVVVAAAIIDALASLDLHYPKVGKAKLESPSPRRERRCSRKNDKIDEAQVSGGEASGLARWMAAGRAGFVNPPAVIGCEGIS